MLYFCDKIYNANAAAALTANVASTTLKKFASSSQNNIALH
jgi:hypothetical protein